MSPRMSLKPSTKITSKHLPFELTLYKRNKLLIMFTKKIGNTFLKYVAGTTGENLFPGSQPKRSMNGPPASVCSTRT